MTGRDDEQEFDPSHGDGQQAEVKRCPDAGCHAVRPVSERTGRRDNGTEDRLGSGGGLLPLKNGIASTKADRTGGGERSRPGAAGAHEKASPWRDW